MALGILIAPPVDEDLFVYERHPLRKALVAAGVVLVLVGAPYAFLYSLFGSR